MGLFSSIGKWVKNAARAAGRAVASTAKLVAKGITKAAELVRNVPIVGKGLSATIGLAAGPFKMTEALVSGKRIDKVILEDLRDKVSAFRDIAPLAQTIVSVVPGVGSVIAGPLAAATAICSGCPLDKALLDGIKGAVPGGAAGQAIFGCIEGAITGKPIEEIALAAAGAATGASAALMSAARSGLSLTKAAVSGKNVAQTLATEAIQQASGQLAGSGASSLLKESGQSALNIAQRGLSGQNLGKAALAEGLGKAEALGKRAMAQGISRAEALGKGALARVQVPRGLSGVVAQGRVLEGRARALGGSARALAAPLVQTRKLALGASKSLPFMQNAQMRAALESVSKTARLGQIDAKALENLRKVLPPSLHKAFDVGMAVGHARNLQGAISKEIKALPVAKLETVAKLGQSFAAKTQKAGESAFIEARRIVPKAGQSGFDLGVGLLSMRGVNEITIVQFRDKLKSEQQRGFDMALSARIGRMTAKTPPANLPPKAKAAYYATFGMAGAVPKQKTAMMTVVAADPIAREGAKTAVIQIAQNRIAERRKPSRGWLHKAMSMLGIVQAELPLETEVVATSPNSPPLKTTVLSAKAS